MDASSSSGCGGSASPPGLDHASLPQTRPPAPPPPPPPNSGRPKKCENCSKSMLFFCRMCNVVELKAAGWWAKSNRCQCLQCHVRYSGETPVKEQIRQFNGLACASCRDRYKGIASWAGCNVDDVETIPLLQLEDCVMTSPQATDDGSVDARIKALESRIAALEEQHQSSQQFFQEVLSKIVK